MKMKMKRYSENVGFNDIGPTCDRKRKGHNLHLNINWTNFDKP